MNTDETDKCESQNTSSERIKDELQETLDTEELFKGDKHSSCIEVSRGLYIVTEESDLSRHKDEGKSIFDVHRRHLTSAGNQRPEHEAPIEAKEQTNHHDPPTLSSYHRNILLPSELHYTSSEPEVDVISHPVPPTKVVKPNRKLYDYRDFQYLEQSRRKRRRKKSEVDIEIVYNLSRFVSRPYEGALDKYSESRSRTSYPIVKSSDNKERHRPRSRTFTPDCDVTKYLRTRRRSISVSPPRCVSSQYLLLRTSHSNRTSPLETPTSSPPTSQLTSPALRRYQRSTFKSILDITEPDNCKLPDIHLTSGPHHKKNIDHFSSSFSGIGTSKPREKTKNNSNKMTRNKNGDAGASPNSHKRVLLNTSLPVGSPTFQRAMKGFNPAEEGSSKDAAPRRSRVRIVSAGGRNIQRMTSTGNNVNNTSQSELADGLGALSLGNPPKSILKNRRRSIDDLDVGTKRGLALYLRSKQQR